MRMPLRRVAAITIPICALSTAGDSSGGPAAAAAAPAPAAACRGLGDTLLLERRAGWCDRGAASPSPGDGRLSGVGEDPVPSELSSPVPHALWPGSANAAGPRVGGPQAGRGETAPAAAAAAAVAVAWAKLPPTEAGWYRARSELARASRRAEAAGVSASAEVLARRASEPGPGPGE